MVVKANKESRYNFNKIYFTQENIEGIKYVLGYARKSRGVGKDLKVDSSEVLKKQRDRIHRICEENNWNLVYFEEIGSGGSVADRKEMQKLQKYVEENADKVDMVLAFDLDRLGREDDMVAFYNKLREEEILVGDSTEDKIYDLNNDTDKTYFDMKRLFAGMEYRKNKVRNKEHRQIAFTNGQWLGGQCPFPYVYNEKTHGLDVVEEYRNLYYDIVDKFLKKWSYTALGKVLDEHGVPTPQTRSKKWDYNAIQTILTSEVHRGMLVVKGYKNPKREYIRLPYEEWSINYNPLWEQLIDKHTSDKILAEFFRRKRLSKKSANQVHSLSGLVYCGNEKCGKRLTINKTPNNEIALRKCECGNRGGKAVTIESDILELLEMTIDDLEKSGVALSTIDEKINFYKRKIEGLNKEIQTKNSQFSNIQDMLSEMWSIYSEEQREEQKQKMKTLNEEVVILKSEINSYEEEMNLLEDKKGLSSADRYKNILKKLSNTEIAEVRNRKYKEFIHKIYWYKTEETMKYTFDLNFIS